MKSYHLTQEQALKIFDEAGGILDIDDKCPLAVSAIDLANTINAALDKVLVEQWQPIATVPVNTRVLMLRMGERGRCGMADGYKQENGVLAWPYIFKEPTHWIPLPAAPREQS